MPYNFHSLESNCTTEADIVKIKTESDRIESESHKQTANAFLLCDAVADGIAKDFAFVKQLPKYIEEILEQKLWERFYVAKGVVTPYYCCYTKGTDVENFKAFVTAKRPNGLGTTLEELDFLLSLAPKIQLKFRKFIDS